MQSEGENQGGEHGEASTQKGAPSPTDSLGDVELLQADSVGEAARLSAAAFLRSPPYAYIFEALDEGAKLAAMTWLFEANIRLRLSVGAPHCVYARPADKDGGEMVVCFMLQPPGVEEIGTWTMVLNGILLFPFRFGLQAFWRLLRVKARHDAIDRAFMAERRARGDGTPFCILEAMAVQPSWQGKGAGSQALGSAMNKATAQGQGVLLSTQTAPANFKQDLIWITASVESDTARGGLRESKGGREASVQGPRLKWAHPARPTALATLSFCRLFGINIRLRIGNGAPRCVYARPADGGGGRGEMVVFFMLQPPGIEEIGTLPLKLRLRCWARAAQVVFFMLQPPGIEEIGTWTMVLNRILLFPFRFGLQAFWRLLELKSHHEVIDRSFMAKRRAGGDDTLFCVLERMVVRPSWKGKGAGSRGLGAALDEAGSAGTGRAAHNANALRALSAGQADIRRLVGGLLDREARARAQPQNAPTQVGAPQVADAGHSGALAGVLAVVQAQAQQIASLVDVVSLLVSRVPGAPMQMPHAEPARARAGHAAHSAAPRAAPAAEAAQPARPAAAAAPVASAGGGPATERPASGATRAASARGPSRRGGLPARVGDTSLRRSFVLSIPVARGANWFLAGGGRRMDEEEATAAAAEWIAAAAEDGTSLPVRLATDVVRFLYGGTGRREPADGGVVSASLLNAKPAVGGIGVEPRGGGVLRVLFTVASDAVADTVVRWRHELRRCVDSTAVFDVLSDREEAQHQALWPAFLAAKVAGKRAQFHRARLVVGGERDARNVTFYSRLGFAVVGEPQPYYTIAAAPTTNYVMAREPAPGAAV
ncbi:hypothetical protein FOA52_013657 [Chlamydomonas sp. UWO 241]|nr:hypothetical protein FOA52_013657 [Chlamydomonas sp. UWO 241]